MPGASLVGGVLVSSTFVMSVVTAVVGAAIAAVIAQLLGATTPWTLAAGVVGFLVVFGPRVARLPRDLDGVAGIIGRSSRHPAHRTHKPRNRAHSQTLASVPARRWLIHSSISARWLVKHRFVAIAFEDPQLGGSSALAVSVCDELAARRR